MKRQFVLFLSLLVAISLLADEVSRGEALKKAQSFMPGKNFRESVPVSKARAKSSSSSESFYIFNAENNDGFVIVSGDDRTQDILGYSDKGSLDVDKIPDNLRSWLDDYDRQIKALGSGVLVANTRSLSEEKVDIEPLIKTRWGQGPPFNRMCPEAGNDGSVGWIIGSANCVTGCVATAMAQIMNYYQWPKDCGPIPGYETRSEKIQVEDLPPTSFKWDLMTDRCDTEDAANAVAELMRYVGQAVKMDYTWLSSGAIVSQSEMINIFNYSKNAHLLSRNNYYTRQWENLVYEELLSGRPLYYSGGDQTINGEGHAFIVDGYESSTNLFHFNWGWGGDCDGFFVLSLADPKHYSFRIHQSALFGLMPPADKELLLPRVMSIGEDRPTQTYLRDPVSGNFADVVLNECLDYHYNIEPSSALTIEIGWGLYQDDQFLQSLGSLEETLPTRSWGTCRCDLSVTFGAGLSDGKYQLSMIYKFPGDTEWKRCYGYGKSGLVAEINSDILTVRSVDTETMVFSVKELTCSKYPEAGFPLDIKAKIQNDGESDPVDVYVWIQKPDDYSWHYSLIYHRGMFLTPGDSDEMVVKYTPEIPGDYLIKITSSEDIDSEALATATFEASATDEVVVDGVKYRCALSHKTATFVQNSDNDNLRDIIIQSSVTASDGTVCQVKAIDDNALSHCRYLKTVEIPDGIERIGSRAFYYNESLEMVKSHILNPFFISSDVFMYLDQNSKATLYVPIGTIEKYRQLNGWTKFDDIQEGERREATDGTLRYYYSTGSKLATVISDESYRWQTIAEVPATVTLDGVTCQVTAIGDRAFGGCTNLVNMSLPNTLRTIGRSAFSYTHIKNIEVPEGVETIRERAFSGMEYLYRLVLPSTLKNIEDDLIVGCNNLSAVVSHIEEPFSLSENAFILNTDVPSPAILYVPIGTKSGYEVFPGWMMFAGIEEGEVLEATDGTLRYSYSTGSKQATVINDNSYAGLTSVEIPASVNLGGIQCQVTAIAANSFKNCWNLVSITLPNSLKTIGDEAFSYSNIKVIDVPEGVESIGKCAFSGMNSLQKLILPSTLKIIGNRVISSCNNLTWVVSRSTNPIIVDEEVFGQETWDNESQDYVILPSTACLHVPDNSKSKYEAIHGWTMFAGIKEEELFEGTDGILRYSYSTNSKSAIVIADDSYKNMTHVTVPATAIIGGEEYTVKEIFHEAFKNCADLTSVTLPSTLVKIGNSSFEGAGISGCKLPNSLKTIGDKAFNSCINLISVIIPEGVESIGLEAFARCYAMTNFQISSSVKSIGDYVFCMDSNLKSVRSRIINPFDVFLSTFYSAYLYEPDDATTLYVPVGTKEKYQNAEGWNMFARIEESDDIIMLGDVNGDGEVDIADAVCIVNHIVGKATPVFVEAAADVNNDGDIDIADAVRVVNLIVGKTNTLARQKFSSLPEPE